MTPNDEVARVLRAIPLPIQPCARSHYPIPPMTPVETAQADSEFFDVEVQP